MRALVSREREVVLAHPPHFFHLFKGYQINRPTTSILLPEMVPSPFALNREGGRVEEDWSWRRGPEERERGGRKRDW